MVGWNKSTQQVEVTSFTTTVWGKSYKMLEDALHRVRFCSRTSSNNNLFAIFHQKTISRWNDAAAAVAVHGGGSGCGRHRRARCALVEQFY